MVALAAFVVPRLAGDGILEYIGAAIAVALAPGLQHESVWLHCSQGRFCLGHKIHVTDSVRLRAVTFAASERPHALHADHAAGEVYVTPSQRDHFFRTHAGKEGEGEVGRDTLVVSLVHVREYPIALLAAQRIRQLLDDRSIADAVHGVVHRLRPGIEQIEDAAQRNERIVHSLGGRPGVASDLCFERCVRQLLDRRRRAEDRFPLFDRETVLAARGFGLLTDRLQVQLGRVAEACRPLFLGARAVGEELGPAEATEADRIIHLHHELCGVFRVGRRRLNPQRLAHPFTVEHETHANAVNAQLYAVPLSTHFSYASMSINTRPSRRR